MTYHTRVADVRDIPAITQIYNQGIEDRVATLETRLRTDEEMKTWLLPYLPQHPVLSSVLLESACAVLSQPQQQF